MLDVKFIVSNLNLVKEKLKYRNCTVDVDEIVSLYEGRRKLVFEVDNLRAKERQLSKEIGFLKSKGQDASQRMVEISKISEEIKNKEKVIQEVEDRLYDLLLMVPNLPLDDVPQGPDESSNEIVEYWGDIRKFDFNPLPHWELGARLGIIDTDAASVIAGSGFVVMKGKGAKLERSIINFFLDYNTKSGYKEVLIPFLVRSISLRSTGQLPKFKQDLYKVEDEDLYLNPTAEVPLVNMFRDKILDEDELPIYITGYAPSFRKEAGAYGKDTRGILRQHQFNKVELIKITRPEDSEREHLKMVEDASNLLKALNLPYRIVKLSAGDMGFSAAKCYDIEVYLPGYGTYREISSVSNCLDFQSRRGNIRFKRKDTRKLEFVHTLNGSGLAVGRTVIAILENYQQRDGSVIIPEILRPYTGFDVIEPI
ncbi:MAG: serine--tRNA ligase [Brevinematales bacterium]|nr:serine--tRNA ligase [Brevinematales bacterium]